ncbi:DUF5990 family protein [Pendulispora brunnea]|uniref:DUF5990 family protein n=1 Tax=Pendulispora brunnea TaxID=2905690 RepID=A0ABZ2K7A3_9BACT
MTVLLTIVGRNLPGRACGPHEGVRVALQVGKEHVGEVDADAPEASWITQITIVASGADTYFRGPAVHGKRGERFLYLAWLERTAAGTHAMFRRAKLQLDGIPRDVLDACVKSGGLRAELGLTACDGLPVCASVRPPRIAWTAQPRTHRASSTPSRDPG